MKRKILNKNFESTYYTAIKGAGVFSLTLLTAITAVSLFSPAGGSHAVEDAEVGVGVGSTINLSINTDKISLSGAANEFVSGSLTATVTTNSVFGYTLNLQDADNSTDLEHETINAAFTSDFEGSKTEDTIADNSWGFSTDSSNYFKIPAYSSPVAVKRILSALKTENDVSTITIGAKIGVESASGKYSDQLILTAYTNGVDDFNGFDEMQSFNCQEDLSIGESAPLRDSRDGSVYMVSKLKNGQCWMTTSLRIQNALLTGEDTDIGINDTFLLRAGGDAYSFNSNPVRDGRVFDMVVVDRNRGGYYSWFTATAGSLAYQNTEADNTAKKSICPKGWRLPTGGANGDFNGLKQYYTNEQLVGAPVYLERDGRYFGAFDNYLGYYWSSTTTGQDSNYVYIAYMSYSPNLSTETNNMMNGEMIRCIARDEEQPSEQKINPLDYPVIQDFNCSSLAANSSTTLRDSRDNNLYTVAKLADNRCWMTQNLRINGKTLTKDDSDISADTFVLPNNNWITTLNSTDKDTAPFLYYSNNTRVGSFYNFTAATAGTFGSYRSESSTESICPKGWTLPSWAEYETLMGQYPNGLANVALLNFNKGFGYLSYDIKTPYLSQSKIQLWTSSNFYSGSSRTILDLSNGRVSASMNYGYSMRCIRRQ